jgi:hypothetical protein
MMHVPTVQAGCTRHFYNKSKLTWSVHIMDLSKYRCSSNEQPGDHCYIMHWTKVPPGGTAKYELHGGGHLVFRVFGQGHTSLGTFPMDRTPFDCYRVRGRNDMKSNTKYRFYFNDPVDGDIIVE